MRRAPAVPRGRLAGVACACLVVLLTPLGAKAFDRFTVTYGLREYAEYNDNLFFAPNGEPKINDGSINTAPDLSVLYDDGETRWLARGSYRRESFFENREASGNYYATSGEFSRAINDRVTFTLLGGYTNFSSIQLGQVLTEPGERAVVRPTRGMPTTGTIWSPSLSVFWSRRFGTTLTYEDNQTFTEGGLGQIERSLALSGYYALTPNTILKGFMVGVANRNSGLPLVDTADTDSFLVRLGFVHTFTPKLTVDFSAGPQWTKDINVPDNVTALYSGITEVVANPVFGTTEPGYVSVAGKRVDTVSLGISFNLRVSYQPDRRTNLSLFASQGTTSGEGAAGTQETQELQLIASRAFSSKWSMALRAAWLKQSSEDTKYSILYVPTFVGNIFVQSPDPLTGQFQALDRESFDINARLEQRQITIEPRLSYRFNSWATAYASWNWTQLSDEFLGSTTQVNRVQLGLEFRKDAYY